MAIRASAPFWAACKPGSMQDIQLILKTMKILSIDHVQIAMPTGEEEKARGFYIGLLGFSEIPKPPELAKRGGAWFQSENVQLHLGVEADFKPARKAHPALLVDDLDSLITKVQTSGYETDTSQPPLDGYKRAHVFDPFGNRIELMEKI
jgi:catechol 2,3-dioxygenase-like lactoylglutathione lyase family enzyme